jgi:hypothetical protein
MYFMHAPSASLAKQATVTLDYTPKHVSIFEFSLIVFMFPTIELRK